MWKFKKAGFDGDCKLFGVNIFDYEWESTGQQIEVLDPLYKEPKPMTVYTANIGNKQVTFAAGEFSNGVYGFYVKRRNIFAKHSD